MILTGIFLPGGLGEFVFDFGLWIKVGVFPFHGWMFNVVNIIKWGNFYLFLSVMKVGPLLMLERLGNELEFGIISFRSSFVGMVGGLNYLSLRNFILYSSIIN